MAQRVMSLKHAKNEVRFVRVFITITKIFAKITREAPGFFCFKHFFMSLSTCGSLKICCNFQWVLVVVRDVEKESEIESEGLQKKAFFFQKRVFAIAKMA